MSPVMASVSSIGTPACAAVKAVAGWSEIAARFFGRSGALPLCAAGAGAANGVAAAASGEAAGSKMGDMPKALAGESALIVAATVAATVAMTVASYRRAQPALAAASMSRSSQKPSGCSASALLCTCAGGEWRQGPVVESIGYTEMISEANQLSWGSRAGAQGCGRRWG